MTSPKTLDVITIGRSSVDLYGQQIGCRLEDVGTFAKSVGGCPSNIAIGTSRLGLKSGLITRVGDEPMGRFILEQMEREGVCTSGIVTDSERLTALVILSVRDEENFPLIFYRDNCADMALCEDDIDPEFIRSSKSVVVTGTHFSEPGVESASHKAMKIASENGSRVVFDIDYRPNLWGLAGHDAGDERYIASDSVTSRLQQILPNCDLIVGTEEELMIAGGESKPLAAIKAIRSRTDAAIVCKRGPMGCVIFSDEIPKSLEHGRKGPGFPVEVYNVLGAGDAFMSGFLRGYLRDESWETCAEWANACGAFAVSRLLCSPEIPTWMELRHFLENGSKHSALRKDADLNHIHWATTRRPQPDQLLVLAIDHRSQLEELASQSGSVISRLAEFKRLALKATLQVSNGEPGFGILLDSDHGRTALHEAEGKQLWIGRPVEKPGSRPLDFEHGGSLAARLAEWPVHHCVKCLCFCHPEDSYELWSQQERELLRLHDACRKTGRELLIEIIASPHGSVDDETIPNIMNRLYDLDIKPDLWKLEPQKSEASWQKVSTVIDERDEHCRGVVVLGLEVRMCDLKEVFQAAKPAKHVIGFAVGRTIFHDALVKWLSGGTSNETAIESMVERFEALVEAWKNSGNR